MAATLLEQITADLDGKYDATFGFAESVTGPAGAFLGIFSNEYLEAAGGFVGASSSAPVLRSRNADALAKGAAVTIRSVGYVVVEVQPNGYGETLHRLQKS
jgi:hypothetical protein